MADCLIDSLVSETSSSMINMEDLITPPQSFQEETHCPLKITKDIDSLREILNFPDSLIRVYKEEFNIREMFEWQVECLTHRGNQVFPNNCKSHHCFEVVDHRESDILSSYKRWKDTCFRASHVEKPDSRSS